MYNRLESVKAPQPGKGWSIPQSRGTTYTQNACKGFLKCPFLAELDAPPSRTTRPLCSDPHCFLIFCIPVHVWPSSERHWLLSNAYWPRLPPSNCRCILPSFNNDTSLGT
ncbi:hypothetical protein OIU84_000739, partial [Salix udensis]